MAVVTIKSLGITNLDAVPFIPQTTGEGGPAREHIANDQLTNNSGDSVNSIYRLCRFPTNAKIKRVDLFSAVATAGAADIDIAFSDSQVDGTQTLFNNLANPIVQLSGPVDNKLFGAAQSLVSTLAAGPLTKTFANTFTPAHQNLPIWQVLVNLGATQFTFDPGGYFDLLLKVTTGITTGGIISAEVRYAM
jgi:hypothetical protein